MVSGNILFLKKKGARGRNEPKSFQRRESVNLMPKMAFIHYKCEHFGSAKT